ncbi:hypothetical protein M8J76_000284 [Diaphorina citri]|nr:hypothetical protein M8J76_000284 [Diaphorina citri]
MSISISSCIFYILTILVAVILLGDGVKGDSSNTKSALRLPNMGTAKENTLSVSVSSLSAKKHRIDDIDTPFIKETQEVIF